MRKQLRVGPAAKKFRRSLKKVGVAVRAIAKNPRVTAKIPMHYLPSSMRPETKFWDNKINATAIGGLTAGDYVDYYPMTGIPQGTGEDTRIGNRIFIKYLNIRFICYGSTSQNGCVVRACLVKDTKPNVLTAATPPVGTDVFDLAGGDTERDLLSLMKSTNGGRFKIVKQKYHFMPTYISAIANVTSGSSTNQAIYWIQDWKVKINRTVEYENSHNSPCSGCHYFMVFMSNDETNDPRVVVVSRLYYTDA